ncbi:hypothetical protein M514_06432 [Trichuris suis]|uniref:FLYWCH-type domain-containing protein n=1 Tax=Trichuris suis TaxID=68888 RepID=A0A085M5T9_9BILA|nr:hypothetical protein M513_06432 [Trichuris suis]KFD63483.1 hypothetical protein M514_06432 [Trichuris suis]
MEYICEFVSSQRGDAMLRERGYSSMQDECRGKKYYWCCDSVKSLYCNARAVNAVLDGKHVMKLLFRA